MQWLFQNIWIRQQNVSVSTTNWRALYYLCSLYKKITDVPATF